MNLTIDAGNTFVKVVIFDNDRIRSTRMYKAFSVNDLKTIFKSGTIHNSILSSVVVLQKNIVRFLQSNSTFVLLDSTTNLPVKNKYKTPESLGSDRLAGAIGAYSLFPKKNSLVIDAGTCVKYDFITSKGEYLGGNISPGLMMRFKALHNFTNRLPLIQPERIRTLIGATTKESILSGVQTGIIHEINGFIQQYKKEHGQVKVLLSGGDSTRFARHIKSSIFAAPNLIHIGLHEILKYNVERT
jgi:type III pantothenate kinase